MVPAEQRCAVIGAGIIGICCAIELLRRGYQVTLYDPHSPGSQTTRGNAGGFGFTDVMPMSSPGLWKRVPGWLLDPNGPLYIKPGQLPRMLPWLWRFHRAGRLQEVRRISRALESIMRPAITDTRELISEAGIDHMFMEHGALTVYPSRKSAEKDHLEWEIKKSLGIEVHEISGVGAIRELEPQLENARFGYFTPQWSNISNPYRLARVLADRFVTQGGRIETCRVADFAVNDSLSRQAITDQGKRIEAEHFVVASGIWSARLVEQLGERVLMESERGYNTTIAEPGVQLNRQITLAREKFVITRIDSGLRIGGAAEFAGIEAPANYERSRRLVALARRYLPDLQEHGSEHWMGQRPATPDSLPVISRSGRLGNVYYAFGHGHYGMTLAATTGKLISAMVAGETCPMDVSPFSIDRFQR